MANQPLFPQVTGFEPEIQDISRQRELSKLLLQQGLQGNLKGQMVGNIYVPSHPLEGIADIYSAYKGRQLAKEADEKQAQLAETLRKLTSEEGANILEKLQGRPAQEQILANEQNVPQGQTVIDNEGNPTLVQAARPELKGSTSAALAEALRGRTPLSQNLASKLFERQFREPKWEKVERLNAKGDTVSGMVDVNSPQPELTFREIGVSKPAISQADAARLRDEGINIGGSSYPVVSPVPAPVSTQTPTQGGGQARPSAGAVAPVSAAPTPVANGNAGYVYNPNLSPKQNRELQSKFTEEQQTKVRNAADSLSVIKEAAQILNSNAPSSGRGENIITGAREFFGGGGEASKADARLAILGEKLTAQVPRFSGTTTDKDLEAYRRAAGDLGNANKPIATRLAALDTIITLQKKLFPSDEWDKIDLGGPVVIKNPLGGTRGLGAKTMSPDQFRETLKGVDKEAFDWARKNPSDPRAKQIKQQLGFE